MAATPAFVFPAAQVLGQDDLRTAVIWVKGVSTYVPEYYVEMLPSSPWIHQPFEEYDNLRPDGLAKKFAV